MQINGVIQERKRRTNNTIIEENLEESANFIKEKNKNKKEEVTNRKNKKSFTINLANNINLTNSLTVPIKNILITNAESIIKNESMGENSIKSNIKKTDSSKDLEKGASLYLKEFKEKTSIISGVNIEF